MITTTNPEILWQYKIRFNLIVEQMLTSVSSTNLLIEVKSLFANFKRIA